jgi:hypothetical protein
MNVQLLDHPARVRPAKELAALAEQINRNHELGERAMRRALGHYRAAGEALLKAKDLCKYGTWGKWLAKNVSCSERRAQHYMELARCEVTSDLAEQLAVWRRISGNAPAAEAPLEEEGEGKEAGKADGEQDGEADGAEEAPVPPPSGDHTQKYEILLTRGQYGTFRDMVAFLAKKQKIDDQAAIVYEAVRRWYADGGRD